MIPAKTAVKIAAFFRFIGVWIVAQTKKGSKNQRVWDKWKLLNEVSNDQGGVARVLLLRSSVLLLLSQVEHGRMTYR